MAGLKTSEKRLLTFFGLALFVVLNLLGDNFFGERKTAAKLAIKGHEKKIVDYEGLLRTREEWDSRRAWLGRSQPRFVSDEAASSELENHVLRSAAASGATIDQRKPTDPVVSPYYVQVALQVTVSGSDAEVTRFLSLLQSQKGFYAIPSVKLLTDRKDPSILRGTLTVARWYSTDTATPAEALPPAIGIAGAAARGVANRN